ncbi:MAG TPA: ATPase [Bacteroidales bacterium]|nr:ATPase [Bacteroidales bacterium]
MIQSVSLNGFGPIQNMQADNLQNINLLIGHNGAGKTFFLKALYSAIKTIEQFQRGKDVRTDKEILSEKLRWTFQAKSLGNLVRKGDNILKFRMSSSTELFEYSFGVTTTKAVQNLLNTFQPRPTDNSIFIPAKEILSLRDIIADSKNRYSEFGFDDTYFDLANAIAPTTKGRNYKAFSKARQSLEGIIGGRLEYNNDNSEWLFKDKANRKYEVSLTAEGIKKLSIIDLLLGNHYLSDKSVIIIDEIEANLHPELIYNFLKIIVLIAKAGIQFFISTHSYFVIKSLYILAHTENIHIPTISIETDHIQRSDLFEEMPTNPIIGESINLYKREIDL